MTAAGGGDSSNSSSKKRIGEGDGADDGAATDSDDGAGVGEAAKQKNIECVGDKRTLSAKQKDIECRETKGNKRKQKDIEWVGENECVERESVEKSAGDVNDLVSSDEDEEEQRRGGEEEGVGGIELSACGDAYESTTDTFRVAACCSVLQCVPRSKRAKGLNFDEYQVQENERVKTKERVKKLQVMHKSDKMHIANVREEPNLSTKEPCISAKETCIVKEPCIFENTRKAAEREEPNISAIQPCSSAPEPCILEKISNTDEQDQAAISCEKEQHVESEEEDQEKEEKREEGGGSSSSSSSKRNLRRFQPKKTLKLPRKFFSKDSTGYNFSKVSRRID